WKGWPRGAIRTPGARRCARSPPAPMRGSRWPRRTPRSTAAGGRRPVMKVRLHCPQCAKDPEAWPIQRAIADLEETGIYRLTCRAGHDTAFCLQNFKFELLFDLGIQAIDDGYYREAVSAFASALERFHEFFIEVTLVGGGVTRETYDAAWKNVKNSS